MLDKLSGFFKAEFQLGHMAALMNHAANIVNILRADFLKDADSKNASIDALCELLQSQKDKTEAPKEEPTNG